MKKAEVEITELIEANKNFNTNPPSFNFRQKPESYGKLGEFCLNCEFLALEENSFSNFFCSKIKSECTINNALMTGTCMPACPLGKWKLHDSEYEKHQEEVKRRLESANP